MVFALISGSILLDTFIQWLSRWGLPLKTRPLDDQKLGFGSADGIN